MRKESIMSIKLEIALKSSIKGDGVLSERDSVDE